MVGGREGSMASVCVRVCLCLCCVCFVLCVCVCQYILNVLASLSVFAVM